MIEVVSDKGKGVVIKETMEDDEVNDASETGYRGQSLLLNENDVQTRNMDSTSKVNHPPWSSRSLSDSDISEHPPWFSESMNEKRNKRNKEFRFRIQLFKNDFAFGLELSQDPINMTKVVKVGQGMQEPVYYNVNPLMYGNDYDRSISGLVGDLETWNDDDDLLQQVDPYDWIEHVVDEEIKRPRKRKIENGDESAYANGKRVTFPNSGGSPSFKKRKHVVLDEVPSSPKSFPDTAPSDEACKTLFGSLASTEDPGDSDPFLLGIEEARSSPVVRFVMSNNLLTREAQALFVEVFKLHGKVEALKDKMDLANQ
nr:hypothetical protein [Tanacetum cinerariifolium]